MFSVVGPAEGLRCCVAGFWDQSSASDRRLLCVGQLWPLLCRCGGHRGLAHPRSQDSLLPIRHLLVNTETDSRVKWLLEKFSVCVWRGVSAASKRSAMYSVHAEKWCLRVSVYCVSGIIYQPQPHRSPGALCFWSVFDRSVH